MSLLKLRAAYGQAGQRPSFLAQYATFTIGAGGTLNPAQLGNPNLKPEIRAETEYGVELEFFNKIGFTATYAVNDIRDQILPVPLSYASGFTSQFTNAGTLQNKSLELTLDVPVFNRPNASWSSRLIFDRAALGGDAAERRAVLHGNGPAGDGDDLPHRAGRAPRHACTGATS